MLTQNILRLRSSTEQKEYKKYKKYKEYEEFKELLRRHLVFATRSFNERTRLIRGARPASWYSLVLLVLLVMPSIKTNLRNHFALIPGRLRY
jgi:hypothetical protein